MAFPQGINHRNTSGYVSDGTNEDYANNARGPYPWTTAQGNNVGFEIDAPADITNVQPRDRNSGNDRRIAGFAITFATCRFRIDLPSAGNYYIGLGAGDANYAAVVGFDLYDGASSLGALTTGSTSAAQRFKDATDTEYTNVTWPTTQATVNKTFAGTILRVQPTGNGLLSHIYVEAAAGASDAQEWLYNSVIQKSRSTTMVGY